MGCDCDVEIDARGKQGVERLFDEGKLNPRRLGLEEAAAETPWAGGGEAEEPHLSMAAAAEVAEAMEVAEIGSGWL